MAWMQVGLAGQVAVAVDGRAMDLAALGRRDTLVLAYLVLERARRVAQSELAEVVWEERVPATWKTAIRGSVSRVRSLLSGTGLPEPTLVTGTGWYELHLPHDTAVDVERAGALVAEAGAAADGAAVDGAATHEWARVRDLACEALVVARRPFLVGVDAAWVEQRQQLLDDLRLRCLELLAAASIHSGDWVAAREHAGSALGLAPLRESVHRLLALAHAGAGNRGEAIAVLAACRRALVEELGVSPSPETEALSIGLLRGAPLPELLAGPAPTVPDPQPAGGVGIDEISVESASLVGRSVETGRLLDAWKRACGGAPELAIVVGEPGVGKSRLVAHLAETVAGLGATVLYGRCEEGFGGGVMADALRGHVPVEAAGRAGFAEVVRSALCRLGARAPVLLVLDDLHLLDRRGLALVRYVLRCPDPLPLLAVGTFSTGAAKTERRLAEAVATGRDLRPVACIDLYGLAAEEVAGLVQQVTGYQPEPALLASIADATGGNPLFVRELVQLWVTQGRARVTGGRLSLAGTGSQALPDGVRETILARYRRLTEPTRRVLAVAAVAGQQIDLAQLEMVPHLSTVDVLAALEEAVAARLMVERSAGRFAFGHGLVPETLRSGLSAARRQHLHIDLATALEARPGTAAPDPARIAYHLLRGGPAVADRAVVAASRAAAEAQHRHAYAEAAQQFAAALAVVRADPVVACRLRLEQAWALWRAGEMVQSQEAFRAAAADAAVAGRPDLAGHAVFGMAGHGPSLGVCDDRLAEEIATALDNLAPDDPFRPRLLARLGAELAGAPEAAAADRCREAVTLAEACGDRCSVAYALHCLNWASLADPGDRDGLARAQSIVETGQVLGDRHMEIEGRLWRCTFLLRAGRVEQVPTEADALGQVASALRQPFFLRLPIRLRGVLALIGGDPAAEAVMAEVYSLERRAHPRDAEIHAMLREVALAHTLGRWPDLGRRLSGLHGPHWTVVRAVWLAASGDVTSAAAAVKPVLANSMLRHNALAPFVAALLARACATNRRFAARVDAPAVRSLLQPWAGTHAVAGCAVASLGPIDDYLAALA